MSKPKIPNEVPVRVGQIWADNDPRSAGRTLRVDAIVDGKALCTTLTNADDQQRSLDGAGPRPKSWYRDRRGKQTKISLSRFKPNATGYRLVEDAPARSAVEALPKGPPEC